MSPEQEVNEITSLMREVEGPRRVETENPPDQIRQLLRAKPGFTRVDHDQIEDVLIVQYSEGSKPIAEIEKWIVDSLDGVGPFKLS